MIIAFKNNFIFIRPRKVAGSSLFKALRISIKGGKNIVQTPERSKDFKSTFLAQRADYYANILKISPPTLPIITKKTATGERLIHTHSSASATRFALGEPAWQNMFKWTTVRNPFDRIISDYCNQATKFSDTFPPKTIDGFRQWVLSVTDEEIQADRFYFAIDEEQKQPVKNADGTYQKILDFYVRYEHLEEDIQEVSPRLNLSKDLWQHFQKAKVRGNLRPPELTVAACFAGFPEGIARVEELTEPVLTTFGYDSPKP